MRVKAFFVVLLLAVTACGSIEEDPEAASGGGDGATSESESTATSEPGDYDPEATFTWIYSVDNTNFDPDKITTNNSLQYLYPIYDSLVHIDEKAEPQPMLAESWEVSEDGKTLEMKLIEDWQFHDGTRFDAAAVKANIERSKTLPGSFNAETLAFVTDVEAVDDDTVRIHTDTSASPLIGILGGAAGMMMSPAAFDEPGQDIKPTGGSGAFTMASYTPGDRVEYEAVDGYWDPEALRLKRLVIRIAGNDDARLNAVVTGAADSTFLRANMVDAAAAAPGMVVFQAPSLSTYNITLNTSLSEFGDARVRKALSYAIDREAISVLLDGLCEPSQQIFPAFYWAGSEDLEPNPYDPENARELLAEAGLADGFSFELQVINLDVYQQIAEIVQQQLAEVGIEVSIVPKEILRLGEDFSVNKTAAASLSEQKANQDPAVTTAGYYLADGFENPGGYTTEEITELHNEALLGSGPEERGPVYQEMMEKVAEEVYPNVTLCTLTTPFIANERVQGLEIYADASRQFRGVSIARD